MVFQSSVDINLMYFFNLHGRLWGHDWPKWNLPMKIYRLSYFNCSNGRIYYENQKTVPSTVQQYTFWQLEAHTQILTDLWVIILCLHFLGGVKWLFLVPMLLLPLHAAVAASCLLGHYDSIIGRCSRNDSFLGTQ